ncbi:hypothetical protein IWQ47_000808 [Aquimarina sp. EL_43]|uniref:hypothetical protein n=1 Tax=Aquimarina TaxID=290174 RepID=UPI0005580EA5|nr:MULTISPECIES: hypothetical protein [Aquimarina]MBG6129890.1 hypothetical protein [Aquimarina sp. EL_35]MBG6150955.1 hypothetical protein [Aquimarina sp. EL_32]MBG6167738.1 hypothetical protein [Aquimarina sp. EL_43]
MIKIILLLFLLFSFNNYAQCLSKVQLIFEDTSLIVMNNGEQYQISTIKPFYRVNDPSIPKYISAKNQVLRINRVLLLKNNQRFKRLVEWTEKGYKYYEYRDVNNIAAKKISISIIKEKRLKN